MAIIVPAPPVNVRTSTVSTNPRATEGVAVPVRTAIPAVGTPVSGPTNTTPAPPRNSTPTNTTPAPPRNTTPAPPRNTTPAPSRDPSVSIINLNLINALGKVLFFVDFNDPNYSTTCIVVAEYFLTGYNELYMANTTSNWLATVNGNGNALWLLGWIITHSRNTSSVRSRLGNSLVDPSTWNSAMSARNKLLELSDMVNSFATRAKNLGYMPPDNPFTVLAKIYGEGGNPVALVNDAKLAEDLIYNLKVYVDLLQAEKEGSLNLQDGSYSSTNRYRTTQLIHADVAYDGFGGTGNAAADLMKFLPSADQIKAEKARRALSVLDFSKRIPEIVFTAEYVPDPKLGCQGILICWKKIADASGFILKRHDVFTARDSVMMISNKEVRDATTAFMEYAKTYALSFYDQISPESISLWLDATIPQDEYFLYTVSAYQVRKESNASIIPSNYVTQNVSVVQQEEIKNRIKELDPTGQKLGVETISPYPAFAERLLGDSTLDWLLAGVNIRASIDRSDSKDVTRAFSYLNANSSFLLNQAAINKFVRPRDVDEIKSSIENSIQTFGVSQTIQYLMQETGILYFFEGRDARDDVTFDRAGMVPSSTSNLLGTIFAAADPETATIDLKKLASNLADLLKKGPTAVGTSLSPGSSIAKPSEIALVDPEMQTNTDADEGVQFISHLGDFGDSIIDLNTFDGISKLMRTIRIMSDFGPDKVPPKSPAPTGLPAPTTPPPPAPPPAPVSNEGLPTGYGRDAEGNIVVLAGYVVDPNGNLVPIGGP